jgi:hypothetical protein
MLVGHEITPELAPKLNMKTPSESGIVYHFPTQEVIFDYVFSKLGVAGSSFPHPIVLTEPVCNPSYCRESKYCLCARLSVYFLQKCQNFCLKCTVRPLYATASMQYSRTIRIHSH